MDSLYQVVYDARAAGFPLKWAWLSPLLVSLAAFVRLRFGSPKGPERVLCGLVVVVTVGLTVFSIRERYAAYRELRRALETGQYALVEGRVEGFRPGRQDGHENEQFRVGAHRFESSPFLGLAGFRQLRASGGPIREGLHVRIYEVGGTIARLDTARNVPDLPPGAR